MMMRKIYYVLALFLLTTCNEEEITSRSYPRIKTYEVTNITSIGAVLTAEVIYTPNATAIVDHGFLWSTASDVTLLSADKISLGARTRTGKFTVNLERSLSEGITYFVRPYAITETHTVYGDVAAFVSLGSRAPELESIIPAQGTWQTMVTLKGKNFGKNAAIEVTFDSLHANIGNKTDTSVVAYVPTKCLKRFIDVSISISKNKSTLKDAFELLPPTIETISATVGKTNDIITISGVRFSPGYTKIFFDNREAAIESITATQIKCKIPSGTQPGDIKLKLTIGTDFAVEKDFFIQAPLIQSIEPITGTFGDEVTIKGQYFGATPFENQVTFSGAPAEIISGSSTEIVVRVPQYLHVPTHDVAVHFNDNTTTLPDAFTLLPPAITSISPTHITLNGYHESEFRITGNRFSLGDNIVKINGVTVNSYPESASTIVAFVKEVSSFESTVSVTTAGQTVIASQKIISAWKKVQTPSQTTTSYGVSFVHDGKAYVGLGGTKFLKFDPATEAWTSLSDFPGEPRDNMFYFTIGNLAYVGGGSPDAIEYFKELWAFDFNTESWTLVSDLPFANEILESTKGFTLSGRGFIFTPDGLFEYDPATNTWNPRASFPGDMSYPSISGFTINDDLYTFGHNYQSSALWKYSLGSNTWTSLGEVVPYSFYGAFIFEFGTKVYFGGAFQHESVMWEYDIAQNQFVQQETLVPDAFDALTGRKSFVLDGIGYVLGTDLNSLWAFNPNL
jgi:N-acetylneuraminic acid mutarotase